MKIIAQSDRIYLREITSDDGEIFYHLNLNPEVIRYTGDIAFRSIAEAQDFYRAYNHFEKFGMGRWTVVLKENQEVIGWCGLKYHPEEDFVDLGFRFFQEQWGEGYATEASKLSLEYGFTELGIQSIIGRADRRNLASIRVLQKLGMTEKGKMMENGNEIMIMEISREVYLNR